jgi:pimeloyl-ACP methyl ester carboxylesterase
MATAHVNGVDLHYESAGEGDPLVLVNGGFLDHTQWLLVVPAFAESFRVIAFDSRGHGQSTGVCKDSFEFVEDLAELIEALDAAPAHLVGHSGGGLFVLHLVSRRPELVRSVSVHEPAVMSLLTGAAATTAREVFSTTAGKLQQGDLEVGLSYFVASLGGDWSLMPSSFRDGMLRDAHNYAGDFFGDLSDPIWHIDASAISQLTQPMQLIRGDQSPPLLQDLNDAVEQAIPRIEVEVIEGAGHMAMVEQPARYAAAVTSFIRSHERAAAPRK